MRRANGAGNSASKVHRKGNEGVLKQHQTDKYATGEGSEARRDHCNGRSHQFWGLIPGWAKDDKLQYSTFNARSEEFTTKPAYRDVWKRGQRCLILTDGFYEWKKLDPQGKQKQAYAIAAADSPLMVMAGLWSRWKSPASGEEILSCTILTCSPNNAMGELHDRMPVILAEADWPKWLGETPATEDELLAMLRPCPR